MKFLSWLVGIGFLLVFSSCGNKPPEVVGQFTIDLEVVRAEIVYVPDKNGVYQISSSKINLRTQMWVNGVKQSDETSTDSELPDHGSGEFDSLEVLWEKDESLSIHQSVFGTIDGELPGMPPLEWDETFTMRIQNGSKDDFQAGKMVTAVYTETAHEHAKKRFQEQYESMFDTIIPILQKQVETQVKADTGKTVTTEMQQSVEAIELKNIPYQISKEQIRNEGEGVARIRIHWTFLTSL
ncbi:hypothetical protein [Desulfoluna spongiiphila]|uniref:hypothetical protein n=1 Tax=Desulfoluna spongiiphila TaxID=419481 RepID=UPI00125BB850|nr:hypothetical protein [Desulfoluna spongiiphila]VVS92200.1 prokaryotic membrane lipoprotein lipid attachment site profile [Desulfoluna spongiiphila]